MTTRVPPLPPDAAMGLEDTIDRMPDDAPMLDSMAVKHGRLDDTPTSLVADYLKALPTLPKVGAIIAERWRIERLLGEGGFGAVFEGRDQQLGRKVAIKVLRAEGQTPTDALAMREAITRMNDRRRRFRDEARAVARAESPNVVTVYDVGEHGDDELTRWPFLVLELVEGTPLDRVVRDRPTPEVALHILEQLVQGVATLHERGVVHRDLKPANAILTSDGRVKIIDFGLAIAAKDWTEIKGPRAPEDWIEGTPVYMSPEVGAGADPNLHADLWALGVIAYELVTGHSPWGEHLTLLELERRIAHEDPLPITSNSDARARWIAHLTPIIAKLLAKRPADRFQSASDIATALASLRQATTRAPAPTQAAAQPFRYLLAFEEHDATWFFGREEITKKLVLALEQRGRLVIAGPSGAGKTSLVQAGLIPELKVLRPLEVLRMQPGRDPLARLAAIVPEVPSAASDATPTRLTADQIRAQPGLVGERIRWYSKHSKRRILVQIDALEELITQDAPIADVECFGHAIEGLYDATRSVLLVMAVRDEYLGVLPRMSRALEATLRDAEFLGPPPPSAMVSALVQPARRLGVTWQAGFPEEMVDAVKDQASPLPVLQLAASWLWEKRANANVLARRLLANDGEALRIGDVLGHYADHKLRAASWSEPDRALVRRLLPVLVSAEMTPLIVPIDDILRRVPPASHTRARELLRDLTDFRLLTSLRDDHGRESLTPVHTTLIHSWSLLRDALDGTAELEAFLRRFDRDAREWHASQRDPAKLWPGAATREFERWSAPLADVSLSPTQRAFRAAVTSQARRATIIRWGLIAVLAALALGGTWAGLAFSSQADEAQRLRVEALAQKASAEHQTTLSEAHRREADELIDFMLGDLRERLEPLGQVSLLRSVAEQAQGYLDRRVGPTGDASDATRRATVLRNLSAVFLEEGDTTRAEKAARDALAIIAPLATDRASHPAPVIQREHALSLTTLGLVASTRGEPAAALDHYKGALLIYDALAAATPDDLSMQRDVSVINDRIGDVLTVLGQTDAAMLAQRASLTNSERLLAADPSNPVFRRDVLVANNKIAISLQVRDDLPAARAVREASIPLAEAAAKDADNAQAQRDLAVSRAALGDVLLLQHELSLALASYEVALAIDKRLAAADPTSANAQRDLGIAHNKVGDVKLWTQDPAGAMAEYALSILIAERLATADPANARFQQDHGHTLSRLGNAHIALGDNDRGLAAKAKMLAIFEALDATLGTDQARIELIQTHANHAEALAAAGQLPASRAEAERARAMLAPLLAKPDAQPWWKGVDEWLAQFLAR